MEDFKMNHGEQTDGFKAGKDEIKVMSESQIEGFRDSNLEATSFNTTVIEGYDSMNDDEKSFEFGRFNGRRMAIMKKLGIWDGYVRNNNE